MIKFLLPAFLLISIPAKEEPKVWFCSQVGLMKEERVQIITFIWTDKFPHEANEREATFGKYVQKITKNTFKPYFQAKCKDYYNKDQAEKYRKAGIEQAIKYNTSVLEVLWLWKPAFN